MEQIKRLLNSLSAGQKISIVAALALIGVGLFWLVSWRKEANFKPLYTGMAPEDAGQVTQKLKEAGVEYRLAQNGTTILAPSDRIDDLRLTLAREGLPRSGRIGFEIFDKTNFGLTDFAEHINYRRALEGELERTIMSLSEVERARVHLTLPKDSVFLESREPAKASVLVNLRGRTLAPGSVSAITHLVASAVEGLDPNAVSVVDQHGRLLNRPRLSLTDDAGPSDAAIEYRERIERALAAKLNQAIEPVVGASRFRTGVSVECDMSSTEESEETLDPAKIVAVSSQKTEETTGGASTGGVPGTASNLPLPPPRLSGSSGVSRKTENVTYQASRRVRHVRQPKGAIQRLSVAVLVDHKVRWENTREGPRKVVEPPSPETLKAIRDIAAAVVGLDTDRGDQITVEALPFETTVGEETPPGAGAQEQASKQKSRGWRQYLEDQNLLRNIAGSLLGVLFIAGMLFYLFRNQRRMKAELARRPLPPAAQPEALNPAGTPATPTASSANAAPQLTQAEPEMSTLVIALRQAVEKDSREAARALRGWLVTGK